MWSLRSDFAAPDARRPAVLIYDVYGMVITIGMFCVLLGVTGMQLAYESGGHDPFRLARWHIFDVAMCILGLIVFGFRLRTLMRQMLRATEQHA